MSRLEAERDGSSPKPLQLEGGRTYVLGREGDLAVEEPALSRRHAEARLENGSLVVQRLPGAKNPLFFKGKQAEEVRLAVGEQFVVGGTRFTFLGGGPAAGEGEATPALEQTMTQEQVYAGKEVERLRLRDLLELTEILHNTEPEKFFAHVAGLMRLGTGAAWACVAQADGKVLAEDRAEDSGGSAYAMSKRLLRVAIRESPRPTLHRWSKAGDGPLEATAVEGFSWAACAASRVSGSEALVFYAAGAAAGGELQDSTRFVGLIAEIVGRAVSQRKLEGWHGRLARYFSGAVVEKILDSQDLDSLKPRLAQATVMFFDLRGFSKRSETNADILKYQEELRGVMTKMTECILRENGVVVQYIGDAILACWNVPLEDAEHVDRAARAALAMSETLSSMGWKCGVGLHTGEVVAGSIGSEQVWSYSVLGSVVNQASRIEGITKFVETPVLVTADVAKKVSSATASCLRLGRFQPAGMKVELDLFELAPPASDAARAERYSKALAAFERGEWEEAYELLDGMPPRDRAARFLKSLTESYRRSPPKEWKGVIELQGK